MVLAHYLWWKNHLYRGRIRPDAGGDNSDIEFKGFGLSLELLRLQRDESDIYISKVLVKFP